MNEVVRSILDTLLDRYEQPNRQNIVLVRLSPHEHPLYFSAEDSAPRHEAHDTLLKLARTGTLRLRWRKWEEGNWLASVDLLAEQAASLYTLLGRSPRAEREQQLRRLLERQVPRSEWHSSFLAWARAQLDAHRVGAPLDRDDPRLNDDLLRALAALADLRAPTLDRTLSVRLFGDSKRLESLRGALLRVLRHHDPDATAFGDDDWALLRAHNLDRAPEYVPIAGPLVLRAGSTQEEQQAISAQPSSSVLGPSSIIDLTLFQPSVALSAAMLRTAEIAECSAACLITIENTTSFSELVAVRPPDALVAYTGGFASPTVIELLRAIRTVRPDLALLHWGDLDVGGLRILAHLRKHIADVCSLAMSPATFEAYRAFAQPLSGGDRAALTALRQSAILTDCVPLIDTLLASGQKLEQEAIDVTTVLNQISTTAKYHRNHCK